MKRSSSRRWLVFVWALACAAAAMVSRWPSAVDIRTEDHNGDGRPDVWRTYDPHGQLRTVAVDTNFDGRSDVREYYSGGALVRRDSDRDFNDRVDLVEEFNPTTRERVRSVVDVDYNGTADLLVLFQAGRPIFSKWVGPPTPNLGGSASRANASASERTADAQLAPLDDPFSQDAALRAVRVLARSGEFIGLSTSGGMPSSPTDTTVSLAPSSSVSVLDLTALPSATVPSDAPRGPPLSPLLS
jgi:hypothetical protein